MKYIIILVLQIEITYSITSLNENSRYYVNSNYYPFMFSSSLSLFFYMNKTVNFDEHYGFFYISAQNFKVKIQMDISNDPSAFQTTNCPRNCHLFP